MFCLFTPNITSFWWHNYELAGAQLALMSWYAYYVHFEFTFPLLWKIPNEITFKSHCISLSPRVWEGMRVMKIGELSLMLCEILKGPWPPLKSQGYCGSPQKEPVEASFLNKLLVRSLHHGMLLHLEICRSLTIRGLWKTQGIWLPAKQKPYTSPGSIWMRQSTKVRNIPPSKMS